MNFHQILRPLVPERKLGSQDGFQNASRSTQDGPKRLLKSNFFALEIRLEFGLVLDPMLIDFGSPHDLPKTYMTRFLGVLKLVLFCMIFVSCFGSPPRRPKRRPRRSKTSPRAPQEAPRAPQEAPRGPQETPRAGQEDSGHSKNALLTCPATRRQAG